MGFSTESNSIPSNLLPQLSGEGLRIASEELKNKPPQVGLAAGCRRIAAAPDSELALLLLKEILGVLREAFRLRYCGFTHKWHCCGSVRSRAGAPVWHSLPQIRRSC
jgi:hypothetical protein